MADFTYSMGLLYPQQRAQKDSSRCLMRRRSASHMRQVSDIWTQTLNDDDMSVINGGRQAQRPGFLWAVPGSTELYPYHRWHKLLWAFIECDISRHGTKVRYGTDTENAAPYRACARRLERADETMHHCNTVRYGACLQLPRPLAWVQVIWAALRPCEAPPGWQGCDVTGRYQTLRVAHRRACAGRGNRDRWVVDVCVRAARSSLAHEERTTRLLSANPENWEKPENGAWQTGNLAFHDMTV